MPRTAVPFENVAEMLEQLGGIDPRRVRSWPPPGRATEKDVLRLLDHEDRLYELVDGVLVEKVMGLMESAVAMEIGSRLTPFVREHDLGFVAGADGTLKLMPQLVRIPDVSFFSWQQLPTKEYPSDPIPLLYPDLAVEVLSKGNTKGEMERKLREYFFAGTRLVWLVDPPTRTVRVYTAPDQMTRLGEGDMLTGGEVLPGFSWSVRELLARVPRKSPRRRANGKGPSNGKRGR